MSDMKDLFMDDNPFEDPAVKLATATTPAAANTRMEAYNPFEDDANFNPGPAVYQSNPAVIQANQQPPGFTKSAQQTQQPNSFNNETSRREDYMRIQRELDAKAAELNERERRLNEQTANAASTNVRKNNWPPVPDGFCVQPCFYIDIETEIKVEFQNIVRRLYLLWILNSGLLVLNVFGAFCLMIQGLGFSSFIVSLVYLALFSPASFLCWYRPVYKAFRDDSSFQFMVFFFVFFFQFLTTAFMAVGVLQTGACGIIQAITTLREGGVGNTIVGIIVLIIALGFAAVAAIELFLLAHMLRIYRGTEASMDKARTEFASGILGNKIVRQAATDTAAAAISSQLNNRY